MKLENKRKENRLISSNGFHISSGYCMKMKQKHKCNGNKYIE